MPDVLILTAANSGPDLGVPGAELAGAMKQAIFAEVSPGIDQGMLGIEIVDREEWQNSPSYPVPKDTILCPLTLDIPPGLSWPGADLYKQCSDLMGLRQRVARELNWQPGVGNFWLPIVWTAKGPLYTEVIAQAPQPESRPYLQPYHLPDRWRQPLYQKSYRLLNMLAAPPGVYLVQFGFDGEDGCFDRLWPFPAAPALASVSVQTPDLFACHWRCLVGSPITDITIAAAQTYQVYEA